jgi:hypothetical protein
MKIERTEIYGFRAALRGMRNPMDSWDKSDSYVRTPSGLWRNVGTDVVVKEPWNGLTPESFGLEICSFEEPAIGSEDLELARKLIRRGGDHRKFLRYVVVMCDLVIPRYVWQEVDTYKVGTVRNSCSTMNTLGRRHLTQDDFENPLPGLFLAELNRAIDDFREADGARAKRAERVTMKDLLPEGFLQRATYLLNYEVGFRMFGSRRGHRLPMWREGCPGSLCEWIKSWPYMSKFLATVQ